MFEKRSGSAAFTLVEALVVIAILAVLLAILLPVLARSKAEGWKSDCANHLRQLHLASRMYMDENAAVYAPGHRYDPAMGYNFGYWRFWIEDLAPYLGQVDMSVCPAARGERIELSWRAMDGRWYGLLYNINFLGREFVDSQPVRHQDVRDPQGTIEFCDGQNGCIHLAYLHTDLNPEPDSWFVKVRFRHGRQMNAVHFDGHIKAFRKTEHAMWSFEKD